MVSLIYDRQCRQSRAPGAGRLVLAGSRRNPDQPQTLFGLPSHPLSCLDHVHTYTNHAHTLHYPLQRKRGPHTERATQETWISHKTHVLRRRNKLRFDRSNFNLIADWVICRLQSQSQTHRVLLTSVENMKDTLSPFAGTSRDRRLIKFSVPNCGPKLVHGIRALSQFSTDSKNQCFIRSSIANGPW